MSKTVSDCDRCGAPMPPQDRRCWHCGTYYEGEYPAVVPGWGLGGVSCATASTLTISGQVHSSSAVAPGWSGSYVV
jgi:hypothetical protein